MTHTAGHPQRTDRPAGPPQPPSHGLAAEASLAPEIRRRHVRFGARALPVQSPVFGAAIEISDGGMRLESTAPLVVGGSYTFRLAYGARYLNLPGRVAWCRPHRLQITERGSCTIYQAGVELRRREPDRQWRAALAERAGVSLGA
jgi:hypothetical protein